MLRVVCALLHAVSLTLYSYTDRDGIVHFTNVPRRSVVRQGDNSYVWEDETGERRRLRLVEVKAFDSIIESAAHYYALPPALIKAVVAVESNFDPSAESFKGAQGLMQLLPSTAREMFVLDSFDAKDNIFGGTRYLRILANRFAGDLRLTLAAYNAGPNIVERVGDVPEIPETKAYVRRVLILYQHYASTGKTP